MGSIEGKTDEELSQLVEEQKKQIESLERENQQLQKALYRLKKQLRVISRMCPSLFKQTCLFILENIHGDAVVGLIL